MGDVGSTCGCDYNYKGQKLTAEQIYAQSIKFNNNSKSDDEYENDLPFENFKDKINNKYLYPFYSGKCTSQRIMPSSSTNYFDTSNGKYTGDGIKKLDKNKFLFMYVPFNNTNSMTNDMKSSSSKGIRTGFGEYFLKCVGSRNCGTATGHGSYQLVYRSGGDFIRAAGNGENAINCLRKNGDVPGHARSSVLGGYPSSYDLSDDNKKDDMFAKYITKEKVSEEQMFGCYVNSDLKYINYGNVPRLRNEALCYLSSITGSSDTFNTYTITPISTYNGVSCTVYHNIALNINNTEANRYKIYIQPVDKSKYWRNMKPSTKVHKIVFGKTYNISTLDNLKSSLLSGDFASVGITKYTDQQKKDFIKCLSNNNSITYYSTAFTNNKSNKYSTLAKKSLLKTPQSQTFNFGIKNIEIHKTAFPNYFDQINDDKSNNTLMQYFERFFKSKDILDLEKFFVNRPESTENTYINSNWYDLINKCSFINGNKEYHAYDGDTSAALINFPSTTDKLVNEFKTKILLIFNEISHYLLTEQYAKAKEAFKKLFMGSNGKLYKDGVATLFIPCLIDMILTNMGLSDSSRNAVSYIEKYYPGSKYEKVDMQGYKITSQNLQIYLTSSPVYETLSTGNKTEVTSGGSYEDFYLAGYQKSGSGSPTYTAFGLPTTSNFYSYVYGNLDVVVPENYTSSSINITSSKYKLNNNVTFAQRGDCIKVGDSLEMNLPFKVSIPICGNASLLNDNEGISKIKESYYTNGILSDLNVNTCCCHAKTYDVTGKVATDGSMTKDIEYWDFLKKACGGEKLHVKNACMARCIYNYLYINNILLTQNLYSDSGKLTLMGNVNSRLNKISYPNVNVINSGVVEPIDSRFFSSKEPFTKSDIVINRVLQKNILSNNYCFSDGNHATTWGDCTYGGDVKTTRVYGNRLWLPDDELESTDKTIGKILTNQELANNNFYVDEDSTKDFYVSSDGYLNMKGIANYEVTYSDGTDRNCPYELLKNIYIFSETTYNAWSELIQQDNFINAGLELIANALNNNPKCMIMANLHDKFQKYLDNVGDNGRILYNNPIGPVSMNTTNSNALPYQNYFSNFQLNSINNESDTIYYVENNFPIKNYLDEFTNQLFSANSVIFDDVKNMDQHAIVMQVPDSTSTLLRIPIYPNALGDDKFAFATYASGTHGSDVKLANEYIFEKPSLVLCKGLGLDKMGDSTIKLDKQFQIPYLKITNDGTGFYGFTVSTTEWNLYYSQGNEEKRWNFNVNYLPSDQRLEVKYVDRPELETESAHRFINLSINQPTDKRKVEIK